MKKLLFAITLFTLISCHNKKEKIYDITLVVKGYGVYNYQIGDKAGSGVCDSIESLTGTVKAGDYVELDAIADDAAKSIEVELNSEPVLGTENQSKSGQGLVQVQYLVK